MHQVITFLGKYPKKTAYLWQNCVYEGEVFAGALCQFLEFDRMLVLTTEEARETTWPVLEGLHDERILLVPIEIGETPAQLWRLFDKVIDLIQKEDEVTFDITQGLRSIPFMAFLFAAYLKTAKQVTIRAVLYGALELGDAKTGKPAPVIDLSEFITMLDWINATDQFVQTGNARRLANLLNPHDKKRKASEEASELLSTVSQAAFLCQPFFLREKSARLPEALKQAEDDFSVTARPFGVLSEQITAAFGPFSHRGSDTPLDHLIGEFRIIEWYYEHGQLIQAFALAREWLIDAVTYRLGRPLEYQRSPRATMEDAVSGIGKVGRKERDKTGEYRIFTVDDLNVYGRKIYDEWSERDHLITLWNRVSTVRNALSHAQHQSDHMKLEKLQNKAHEARQLWRWLAAQWGIDDHAEARDDPA